MESFTEHEKRADLKQLKTNLVNTICASMIAEPRFDKSPRESEDDTGAQTVVNLVEQIVQVDPEFLLKLAVYVRNDLNIRSTANFLVALAANYKESAPFLKKYFKHVINLPSDWLDVAALYQMLPNRALAGRALPTALRKAMLFKFPDFDTYQLGKYNKQGKLKRSKQKAKKAGAKGAPPPKPDAGGKSTLTLKQMVRQLHIDAPVYHVMCLLGKKYPANETDFRRSGLPGVFEPAKAGSRLKLPVPETWETLLSAKGNKAETWEELIDHKKLPFMAMLRNLRNLILTGVDYKYHRWAMNKLNNEETIARSKQFPFRFFSAYEAIAVDIEKLRQEIKEAKASGVKAGQKAAPAKGKGAKGKKGAAKPGEKGERPKKVIVPKNMPDEGLIRKYREALDNAVKFATVHNVKPIRGNTVVFCSIAESMKGGCKSARGMGSVRTLLDVGVLLGLMCKYMCEECDFRIVGAPGSHTQSHLGVELREGTVLDNMATVLERAASGELADHSFQFPFDYLEEAIRERKVIDNLIVLNDTMLYPEHDAQLAGILKKYRQEVNPELMFVSVNLGSAGKSMEASGDRHPNDVLISGFSDAILRYIAERGDSNQLHYIDHIDKEKGIQTPAVKPRELKRGFGYTSSTYSNPFRSRAVRKPFTLSGRKSFLFDDDDEADDAQAKAAKEEEARRKQAEEEAEEREVDEREKRRVEEQVEKVRSGKWRAVRVFVSSTFRDMHGERDYLVRYVFPELRERCRKRRLHFYDVDLRWGVTQEEAETEGALHICLNEIDRCRPFFIGLLGERYGWRPATYELPEEPRYLWAKKYPQNRSITELEMFYGALRCPSAAESYFYFRNPAFASSITDEAVQADFCAEDAHAQERLKALKQEIRATFPDRSRNYSCGWAGVVGGKPMVDRLEQFGRHILEDLWKGICRTFPEVSALGTDENRLSVARESHEEYAISRTRVFVGRDDLIKTMTKFVDGDEPGPLVVTGEPGSGKSALVAQFSRLYADKNSEALVIAHYVGAATEARDIRHALLRIALELKEQLQLSEEVPEEEKELRQVFGSVLEAAGFAAGGRKVVILIDGINQMEAKDKALDWLPGSTRVRMVVSTHADTPSHHALRHRKPQPPEIAVGPLEENHRKSLVRAVLAEYRKKLDEAPGNNQMRVLLRKPESHKPLYLVLACEELRLFGLYEQLSNKIKTLGGTVPKLFDELLHRLESDHEKETLKLTLSLLVASRAGLLEAELLTILARDKKKEAELPRAVWATIFAALQPFFRPVGPSGEDALSFFHAQMEISVRKRYLSIRNNELRVQKQLANYFLQRARVPSGSGNDAWQWVDDRRAISELPHHLAKAQMWDELESVLCDLSFVKLKCRLGMAFDLLNDYNEALATEHQWDGRERLEQFQAFFAGNAHILGRYPDLTLQQAANQPDSSAPAQAAQGLLSAGSADGWVRWINKPQDQGACKLTLASERDPVLACAFSPDGKELVLASRDGTLRICDAATGAESATLLGHTNWVVACAYSYDGARIVSASWDGTLKIWDTRAGVEVATLRGHGRRVNACAFSNDGQRIASASWDCTVRLWDGYSGQLLKTFHGHTKPVNAVAFSPDGRQIVSASWDSSVKLWDVEQGTEVRTFSGHSKSVRSVQFSPTGAQIVSTSVDTTLRVWDARTGEIVTTLEGHSKAVNACAFSPDGRHLVSASDDQTVKVWDALGGREITKMGVADMSLNACDISPDGRRIVAALADCTVAVWDVLSGEIVFYIRGHTRTVNAVLFSPGGSYILTTSDDGSLKLWSARDGSLARTLTGHRDCVNDACFSPDGAKILSASDDFTLKIWDTESGVEEKEIKGHTNRVTGCAWAPDGKRVASSSRDNSLRIWNPETGDVKKIFKGHMDWLTRCAFSADGKKVVSCSWDYNMKLWDVRAGNEIATLRGHMGAVSAAAFSADGKYLVSASLDGTLKIWDPVKAHEVTALRGHSGRVSCVRFARTGTTFVSSSEDGTVRLWDAEAGQEITTLQGHADAIRQVKYCPDRDQIVSTSDDCTVKVWNAGAQREIAGHSQWVTACALASSARVLATASRDGSIKLWDTRTNRPRTALAGHDQPINCVAVSPDGATVVSASDDFSLKVWSGREGDHLRTMRHHTNSVRWVCFSPNGARVASASWDNTVCVSDPIKGTLHLTLRGHTDWVNACAFSPDGSRIATASHDQTVILWDSTTGARIHTFTHHANWVVALAFSPDSKYLASASYDATVVLTHVERRTTRSFRPHTKRVSALAFTADGAHLLSASYDGCITAHRVADVLSVTDPAPSGRFFTKAPATALCSSASLSAAGDSLGNVYQLNFEL